MNDQIGCTILVPFLGLVVCGYLVMLINLRALRRRPALDVVQPSDSCGALVTVVIAARDEAENVTSCLKSLLAQEAVHQIVLVDDHSRDRTRVAAAELAADNNRLMVLSAPELPDGWVGKSHALHFGAQHAHTEYVLFTDADVRIAPGVVKAAAAAMVECKLDHLGGLFHLRCESMAEQICAPVLTAASSVALFRSAKSLGAATGAFNMLRTEFYRKNGGHQPICNRVVDDVALARHAKANGARTAFFYMGDSVSVRLFRGFSGFSAAVVRSAVPFLTIGRLTALVCAFALGLVAILTMTAAPVSVGLMMSKLVEVNRAWGGVLVLSVAAYILGFACTLQTGRYHDGKPGWGLLYPLPLLLMACATGCAAVASLLGKKMEWRGRAYEHL